MWNFTRAFLLASPASEQNMKRVYDAVEYCYNCRNQSLLSLLTHIDESDTRSDAVTVDYFNDKFISLPLPLTCLLCPNCLLRRDNFYFIWRLFDVLSEMFTQTDTSADFTVSKSKRIVVCACVCLSTAADFLVQIQMENSCEKKQKIKTFRNKNTFKFAPVFCK